MIPRGNVGFFPYGQHAVGVRMAGGFRGSTQIGGRPFGQPRRASPVVSTTQPLYDVRGLDGMVVGPMSPAGDPFGAGAVSLREPELGGSAFGGSRVVLGATRPATAGGYPMRGPGGDPRAQLCAPRDDGIRRARAVELARELTGSLHARPLGASPRASSRAVSAATWPPPSARLQTPQPDGDGAEAEKAMAAVMADNGETTMAFSPFVVVFTEDLKAEFARLFRCGVGAVPDPSLRLLLLTHQAVADDVAQTLDNCLSGVAPASQDVKTFLERAARHSDPSGGVWGVCDEVVQADSTLERYLGVLAELHARATTALSKMAAGEAVEGDDADPPRMPAKRLLAATYTAAREVARVVRVLNNGGGDGSGGGVDGDAADGGVTAQCHGGGGGGGGATADDEIAQAITMATQRGVALRPDQRQQLQVLQGFARDWDRTGTEGMGGGVGPHVLMDVQGFGSTPRAVRMAFLEFALEQVLEMKNLLDMELAQRWGTTRELQLLSHQKGAAQLLMMSEPARVRKMTKKATLLCSNYDIEKYYHKVVVHMLPLVSPHARACLLGFLTSRTKWAFSLDGGKFADRLSGHLTRHYQALAAFLFQCGVAYMWAEEHGNRTFCPIDEMSLLDPEFRSLFNEIAERLVLWRQTFDPDPAAAIRDAEDQKSFLTVITRITQRAASRQCQVKGHTHKYVECPQVAAAVKKLLVKLPTPSGGW